MVKMGSLVMQVRVSGDKKILTSSSRDTFMDGNFLYKCKFSLQKEKFILYFQAIGVAKRAFLAAAGS